VATPGSGNAHCFHGKSVLPSVRFLPLPIAEEAPYFLRRPQSGLLETPTKKGPPLLGDGSFPPPFCPPIFSSISITSTFCAFDAGALPSIQGYLGFTRCPGIVSLKSLPVSGNIQGPPSLRHNRGYDSRLFSGLLPLF